MLSPCLRRKVKIQSLASVLSLTVLPYEKSPIPSFGGPRRIHPIGIVSRKVFV